MEVLIDQAGRIRAECIPSSEVCAELTDGGWLWRLDGYWQRGPILILAPCSAFPAGKKLRIDARQQRHADN